MQIVQIHQTLWLYVLHHVVSPVQHHGWVKLDIREGHTPTHLKGQAANVLHSIPEESTYEDAVETLEGQYGIHQLAATTFPS
jgi:hypothetical protein